MAAPCGQLRSQRQNEEDISLRNPKVKNPAGGFVNKISDLQRFQRFVIIGTEGGTFYTMQNEVEHQNVDCLKRIIAAGDGKHAVRIIEDVSVNQRNVRQTSLLKALAICARCNDKETKTAAYKIVSKVCRIPTFLFEFINHCGKEQKQGDTSGKGWGRAQKKAMTEWYKSFKDNPEHLARLVTKFKKRKGWSHTDVLRLAHSKTEDDTDKEVAFILRYIVKGHDKAKKTYMSDATMVTSSLQKVSDLLSVFDAALDCHDENHLVSMIREHKLTWEQCPTQFLRSADVWKALLRHIPIEALIKNLGRMSSLGVFAENSEEEELAIKKIDNIKHLCNQQPQDDNAMDDEPGVIKNIYHPFKLLIGLVTYNEGKGDKGKMRWTPNEKIVDALDAAFYKAFERVEPTGKKYYLAIDVSGSMSPPVLGTSSITYARAAAAMLMLTVRTEQNTVVRGFSHDMRDININKDDKLDTVMRKVTLIDNAVTDWTDCSLPMKDAMERKIRDIDVFVIYTDSITWSGNCHPSEALRQYRQWSDRREAKLIVCGMCATEFSIADKDDKNMLDVVGFDTAAPRVISMFASGNICSDDMDT